MRNKGTTLLAVMAVILTVAVLWSTNRVATPKEATWQDVLAEAGAGGYRIITTKELAKLYQEQGQKLLLVDTRQEWEYRNGHIQGALNFPMEPTAWARWRKAGALETFLGPDKDRTIIVY
jgi:3-mercaptopyruvate sulfurtransferase SseA